MALQWMALDEWKRKIAKGVRPLDAAVRKAATTQVEVPEEGGDSRVVKFTLSTAAVDRDGDVVNPKGWDLENYRKNPMFIWAHDYTQLPIGRAKSIGVVGDRLVAEAEFQPKELNPMADTVYRMLKGGWLHATSVGFKPKSFDYAAERKGVDFHAQELLEVSVVPIPSNPGALAEAKAAGVDLLPLKAWAEGTLTAIQKAMGGAMGEGDVAAHRPDGHSRGAGDPERDAAGCEYQDLCPKMQDQPCPMAEGCPMQKGAGADITKVGRVLSAKNEAALRQVMEAVQGLLAQLEVAPTAAAPATEPLAAGAKALSAAVVLKRIVARDDEFCVVTEDGSKTLGCHKTRAEALAQLRAVEASKDRADGERKDAADAVTVLTIEVPEDDHAIDGITVDPQLLEGAIKAATQRVANAWLRARDQQAQGRVD